MREFLRREPFQPFSIHLSNGSRYSIRHPECVALGERHVAIEEPPSDAGYIVAFCDPMHVTHMEVVHRSPPNLSEPAPG
jgi:hypothetical protein